MWQWEILMQQARIYRAWLPSEIFWKSGNDVEREKIIACCVVIWCFAKLDSGNRKSQSKNSARSMTSLQYLLNLAPTLDNLTYSTLINCSTKIFQRKYIDEFWFNRCFRESSLEITKRVNITFDWFTDFHDFLKSRECICLWPVVECVKVICKTNEW